MAAGCRTEQRRPGGVPPVDFAGRFEDDPRAGTPADRGARGRPVKGPWPARDIPWRNAAGGGGNRPAGIPPRRAGRRRAGGAR